MPPIDLFSAQSGLYAEFRPTYPRPIYAHLASLAPARRHALDLAAGSGQAACDLLPFFDRVFAGDLSPAQLARAACVDSDPAILRFAAAAESLPLPPACLDLVTVAQAVHWFDFDPFYAEVRRLLRPGGVLAVWTYHLPRFTPAVDALVDHVFTDVTGSYWHPRRALVDDGYAALPFPLHPLPPPPVDEIRAEWTLPDLVGFIHSWSAAQAYQADHRRSPLVGLDGDLIAAWGPPETVRPARFPLAFRVGRVD